MLASQEVSGLAEYLIGERATTEDIRRFVKLDKLGLCPIDDPLEQVLWRVCLRFPRLFACIDSVFAILKPRNQFRRRLFYALSIFEMEPAHYHSFVKTTGSWIRFAMLALEVILYPLNIMLGIALLFLAAFCLMVKC
jgi:hypothetical protein